jgi:hypothetical protein
MKKREHDALLFGEGDQFFSCGAYPLEDIHDPTGAEAHSRTLDQLSSDGRSAQNREILVFPRKRSLTISRMRSICSSSASKLCHQRTTLSGC